MKRTFVSLVAIGVALFGAWKFNHTPTKNPDPNHTHADFAVWVNNQKLDFSGAEFMSGLSTDDTTHDEEDEYHDKYLHLHDGIGYVIHRHKPGLTVQEFFQSIQVAFQEKCVTSSLMSQGHQKFCGDMPFRLFVNGEEKAFDLSYVFEDMDHILITNASDDAMMKVQIGQMTDDACKYSKTCPWKGDPPTENCIADPEVPCVVQ